MSQTTKSYERKTIEEYCNQSEKGIRHKNNYVAKCTRNNFNAVKKP